MEYECILCNQCSFDVEKVISSISEDYVKGRFDTHYYECELTGRELPLVTKLNIWLCSETEKDQINEVFEILMSMYEKIEIDVTGKKYISLHHENLPYCSKRER